MIGSVFIGLYQSRNHTVRRIGAYQFYHIAILFQKQDIHLAVCIVCHISLTDEPQLLEFLRRLIQFFRKISDMMYLHLHPSL